MNDDKMIETWQDLERLIAPHMPVELARAIRDWWEKSPDLTVETALYCLTLCIGITASKVQFKWGDQTDPEGIRAVEEHHEMPGDRAPIVEFPKKGD